MSISIQKYSITQMFSPPCALSGMPSETYHAEIGWLSKHLLDAFLMSPAHYAAELCRKQEAQSHAFLLGQLGHLAVLEPAVYAKNCYVRPEGIDGRTKEGKAWAADHADLPCVSQEDHEHIMAMSRAVWANKTAASVLGSGDTEVSMFCRMRSKGDPEGLVKRKARVDLLTKDGDGRTMVVDYKTCAMGGASPDMFARDVARWGYHLQAQWYTSIAEELGGNYPTFLFIVQEKEPPYNIALYALSDAWIGIARDTIEQALERFRACVRTQEWPGYEAERDVQLIEPPKWFFRQQSEKLMLGMQTSPIALP